MTKRMLALIVAVFLFGGMAMAQQAQGPSLAEIAKKNKERKAKRVITDEDMPSTREGAKPEAESAPAAPAGAAAAEAGAADAKPAAEGAAAGEAKAEAKPGESDSEEVKKLKAQIQSLRDEEGGYTKTADEAQARVDASNDEFRKEMYSRVIENSRTNARELADRRAELEKQLETKQREKSKDGAATDAPPPQD